MYTAKCFIRQNDYHLWDALYRLGGRPGGNFLYKNEITVVGQGYFSTCDLSQQGELIKNGFVDCGENADLFLAIASLRDDSDINQWFLIDEKVTIDNCTVLSKGCLVKCPYDKFAAMYHGVKMHKATVEDLINHVW